MSEESRNSELSAPSQNVPEPESATNSAPVTAFEYPDVTDEQLLKLRNIVTFRAVGIKTTPDTDEARRWLRDLRNRHIELLLKRLPQLVEDMKGQGEKAQLPKIYYSQPKLRSHATKLLRENGLQVPQKKAGAKKTTETQTDIPEEPREPAPSPATEEVPASTGAKVSPKAPKKRQSRGQKQPKSPEPQKPIISEVQDPGKHEEPKEQRAPRSKRQATRAVREFYSHQPTLVPIAESSPKPLYERIQIDME